MDNFTKKKACENFDIYRKKEKNKEAFTGSREELIGWVICHVEDVSHNTIAHNS